MDTTWFEKEIALAGLSGVSHPENMPYLLTPRSSNGHAVILTHGFSSSPREMRSLGNLLQKHNFLVYGLRLPGHGTTPEDLAKQDVENWRQTVRDGYQALSKEGFKISAAGISTGSLLTLDLACDAKLERIVLLAPFLKLRHLLAEHVALISHFVRYQKKNISEKEAYFYYNQRPLKGIVQINKLRWKLKNRLSGITTPALILTSTGDTTIATGTAEEIYQGLGSELKEIHIYGDDVPHGLSTENNPEQQDVLQRCLNFLTDNTRR